MEGRNTNKNNSCRSLHENLALQIEQLVIEQYTKKTCVLYCFVWQILKSCVL